MYFVTFTVNITFPQGDKRACWNCNEEIFEF